MALGNGLHAAYQVQYDVLLEHNLEKNRAYAENLAQVTDSFLISSLQVLDATALDIAESNLSPVSIQKELGQLVSVTEAFNVLVVAEASGKILTKKPQGGLVDKTGAVSKLVQSLLNKNSSTSISGPFQGPEDRWSSAIARPIFSLDGHFLGLIFGLLYLENDSALQNALNKYNFQDGSFFYMVDERGVVLYHPDRRLIGSSLIETEPVRLALGGGIGTYRADENGAHDQIVSFAPIPCANWFVIAQRPTQVVLSPITDLFLQTAYYSLPLFFVSLLAIWWSARLIARPLHELADVAANMDHRANFSRIRFINGWYVEAALIRKGLLESFSAIGSRMRKLDQERATDPLTGVVNRRGLDAAIDLLMERTREVAIIMLDIDYFKGVNDNYGHAIGDEVLKKVSALVKDKVRKEDIVARIGGEEFVVLLPGKGLESARRFAERIRASVEQTCMESAGYVTVSLGVACYPMHGSSIHDALNQADVALYRAKETGRNRVCLA